MDLRTIAQALGGQVVAGQVLAPGRGHSRGDRSLSIRLDARAPGGFLVHTFSGDDPLDAKDYVRERLGLEREFPEREEAERPRPRPAPVRDPGEAGRIATALEIWRATIDPTDTPVARYLAGERRLPHRVSELAHAVRFHSACPFGTGTTPAMVCLVRDVRTNEPRAIHRTALTLDGRKGSVGGHDRLSLGPIGGGAIKLTTDAEVTTCLGVGEGMETALSLQLLPEFGRSPVWSLISAGGIAGLPVLAGIECLWIAVDHDEAGVRAAQTAAARWSEAGAASFLVQPRTARADLNDLFKRPADA